MSDGPRLLQITINNCDECPLRQYAFSETRSEEDAGWDCHHPEGNFRIVDEGTDQDVIDHRNSVVGRMGVLFPDLCPLQSPVPAEPAERTRVVDLQR